MVLPREDHNMKARLLSIVVLLRWTLVTLICTTLVLLWVRLTLIPQHRTDIAGAELNVIYGVQKVMLGFPLYEDPEQPPFDIIQYTPLYYWICGGLGSLLQIDPYDSYRIFLLSRILSLALNLLTVLLVFRTAKLAGAGRWSVWAALLAFTAFTQHFFSRSDALYALLFAATIHGFVQWTRTVPEGKTRMLAITGVCAVLCFMAKQTGILILCLIPFHLLLARQWKSLSIYSASVVVASVASLLIILSTTSLNFFLKNTVQGLMNGTSDRLLLILLEPHRYIYFIGWHLASVLLVIPFMRQQDPVLRFFGMALPLSLFYSVATALKMGSDLNYFYEDLVLVFLALSIALGQEEQRIPIVDAPRPGLRTGLRIAFAVYGIGFAVHQTRAYWDWSGQYGTPESRFAAYQADLHVRDVLKNEMGLRPEDKVFITYRGHLEHLLIGQGLLTQKDIIEWSEVVPFDLTRFDRAMVDGTVRFVITDTPMDTVPFMGRAYTGFHRVRQVDDRYIMARNTP